jgi:MATE family multidrug resistance protein
MANLSKKAALKQLLIFSGPLIFGQVGLMLIGTGDMIIAGRYSKEALAAIGLAISILNPIQISLLGLQFSISPILAQKRGQGQKSENHFWTIIVYSFFVSLISFGLSLLSYFLVPVLNYGSELTRIIQEYILITSASTFGLGLYQGIKEYYQSEEKTLAANLTAIIGAFLNLGLNYVLVFGFAGIPSLKEAGLAWASLTCRFFMALVLFLISYKCWKTSRKINFQLIKEFWKLGLPITATLFLEIMAFCSVTLLIGRLSQDQIAANNIVLNAVSLCFMIPLSISSAVAVKVGHGYGEKNIEIINVFSQMSFLTSLSYALLTGFSFYFFPEVIMSFYTNDLEVIEWGRKLFFWVACFQLFDGAQVTFSGILRGLSLTRPSFYTMLIGYWLVGLPLGYYLGFHTPLEAQGFWIGLALSLALVATMLGVVLRLHLKTLFKNLHSLES